MADSPAKVETFGVEHIPDEARHGRPNRAFTLWFAANLTIADYVIGVLAVTVFRLSFLQAALVFYYGNLLGGLFLGLSAAMGPTLGFPQMLASRASFGRRGNYPLGALNWVSTAGWFAVNTILGTEAVTIVFPSANFAAVASLLVALQVFIAIYGHDFIQLFERVMSAVLGVLFLAVFVLVLPYAGLAISGGLRAGQAGGAGLGAAAAVFAIAFSYIMSWSPYASDYSRYLPASASRWKVAIYAMAGGGFASFAVEAIGALVGSLVPSQGLAGLYVVAGGYGWLGMLAIVLGGIAANALNIYTNALSALVLDIRAKRVTMVVAGGVVGLAISLLAGPTFEAFFENFLVALDYWITPWLAIVLVDFYLKRRTSVESTERPPNWDLRALGVYVFSVAASVPFMVPPAPIGYPAGALSGLFGGADFSYFVSFAIAGLLTYFVRTKGHRGSD